MFSGPTTYALPALKKIPSNFLYIISIVLLNLLLISIFSISIKNEKQRAIQLFNKKLEDKALRVAVIINLINTHITTRSTFGSGDLKAYTDMLQASVTSNIFSLANTRIVDENGISIFTSIPCIPNNLACSIKHRNYFNLALQDNSNKIHIGEIILGVSSKKEAIPFAKSAFFNDNKSKLVTVVGLDIVKLIELLNLKSYISIIPISSTTTTNHYSNQFTFNENKFWGNMQFPYNIELKYNKDFYMAAGSLFLPCNALLILLIMARRNQNAIRAKVFERIQKLFPDEFKKTAIALTSNRDTFDASLNALNRVGIKIDDYKGNIHQVGEAIDKIMSEYKLNYAEIQHLEKEILNMLDDLEINLNAEYKSSILELNEEAKGVAKLLNVVLNSIGKAMKEMTLGKRELTLKEIIEVSAKDFHIESNIEGGRSFWLLKDLFFDRIDGIRQYLINACEPSSLTMSATAKENGEVILEYKGAINKNKSKSEIINMRNCLLHYKLKCLNKLNGVEYEAKDTNDHWLLTITLQP